jgi:hypothetical protein
MQRIQVVKDGSVVNVMAFDDADTLAGDGSHVATHGGDFHAPAGCFFMKVDGADMHWIMSNGTLVAPPPPALPTPTPSAIKAECQRRIYAVASPDCQMNMTAYVAAGGATDADKAAFSSSLGWVMAMRAAYATLAGSLDPTFAQDSHWPACPADAASLAAKF